MLLYLRVNCNVLDVEESAVFEVEVDQGLCIVRVSEIKAGYGGLPDDLVGQSLPALVAWTHFDGTGQHPEDSHEVAPTLDGPWEDFVPAEKLIGYLSAARGNTTVAVSNAPDSPTAAEQSVGKALAQVIAEELVRTPTPFFESVHLGENSITIRMRSSSGHVDQLLGRMRKRVCDLGMAVTTAQSSVVPRTSESQPLTGFVVEEHPNLGHADGCCCGFCIFEDQ